jgi:hypothetical protein
MLRRALLTTAFLVVIICAAISSSTAAVAKTPNGGTSATTTTGYDVSYPQCPSNFPSGGAFGIVGVNNGKAWSVNPCIAAEYAWAANRTPSSAPAFYMNTANPGTLSTHWGAPGPNTCANSSSTISVNDPGCAYNYGWNAAAYAFSLARKAAPNAAAATWWADVETANSWDGTTDANFADIQGGLDYLRSQGVPTAGVYSTSYQFGVIAGANTPLPSAPSWVAGATNLRQAKGWCTPSYSFTGGTVKLVQFLSGGFDGDYACP